MALHLKRKGKARRVSGAAAPEKLELVFAEPAVESFLEAYARLAEQRSCTVGMRPFTSFAAELAAALMTSAHPPRLLALGAHPGAALARGVESAPDDAPVDVTFICAHDPAEVSSELMRCLDLAGGAVVAARTPAFWNAHPLFLISIPKAGTHLLYELARTFGYAPGIVCPPDPQPGSWYCVEYSNSHTSARDFFVDTVRRSHFGNRHHPFLRAPALFIYRNPLDILVSEASYYHRDGNTAFYGYLSQEPFETRLLKLVDDPWLLGSVRDRIGNFLPWLELPNVIPVSFEELVGSAGGGSAEAQTALIWSLQLKLHVPGSPRTFAQGLFNRHSATFREGQIGGYRTQLTAEAFRKFLTLPQDFMTILGYPISSPDDAVWPRRAEEFRRRPLKVSGATFDFPIAVEYGYRGFNIVFSQGSYFGLPQDAGPVDLRREGETALTGGAATMRGDSLEAVKAEIDRHQVSRVVHQQLEDAAATAAQAAANDDVPRLVEAAYFGYNVVQYRGQGYALSLELGPLDLQSADLGVLEATEQCLVRPTVEDARRAVLELRLRSSERTAASLREMGDALRQELDARVSELAAARADVARAFDGAQATADHVRDLERALAAAQKTYAAQIAAFEQEFARAHQKHGQQIEGLESDLKRALNQQERRGHEALEIERKYAARIAGLEVELAEALRALERGEREAREAETAGIARVRQLEADVSGAIETLEQQVAASREAASAHAAQVRQLQTDLAAAIEGLERRGREARDAEPHAERLHALERNLSVSLDTVRGLGILLQEREERIAWLRRRVDAAADEVAAAHEEEARAETRAREAQAEQQAVYASAMERLRAENDELRRWIERLQDELVDSKARRGLIRGR